MDFSGYNEISISNIKQACERFYEMPAGSCDILLGDRGPSCYLDEQILGKKFYYIRFVDPRKNPKKTPPESVSKIPIGISDKSTTVTIQSAQYQSDHKSLPPVPSSAFPKSISVVHLLKAGKLVRPPDVKSSILTLEMYEIAEKRWKKMSSTEFQIDNKHFAEGGFRQAYMATTNDKKFSRNKKWVVKISKDEVSDAIEIKLGLSIEDHTRKQVQLHSAARSIAQSFASRAPTSFGELFRYKKIYYAKVEDTPVTVEEFIPGKFEKYINNNGQISSHYKSQSSTTFLEDNVIVDKAESLVHFSYIYTKEEMMLLDIQGVGYDLCDPEIATARLKDDNELNLFCAGNLSTIAIQEFLDLHTCNQYCKLLKLDQ